jgi:hypothetical protein
MAMREVEKSIKEAQRERDENAEMEYYVNFMLKHAPETLHFT